MRDQDQRSQYQATIPEIQKKVQAIQLGLEGPALRLQEPCMHGFHPMRFAQQKDATGKGNIQQVAIGHVVAKEDM